MRCSAFFGASARPRTEEVVDYIDANRDRFGGEPICEALPIAPSAYYAATTRESSARALRREKLKPEIERVYAASYDGCYGARKVWRQISRGHPRGPVHGHAIDA